jgi:UDP-N-acetylmuramate--alanine ligase
MELNQLKKIYFIGIGGIGMSALARYFIGRGVEVHGYDKTETVLTQSLAAEGMRIHYSDDVSMIPENVDLVIYTPAIKELAELTEFKTRGVLILKRSQVLGLISRGMKCIGVAGTHGKTTTSSLLTHILRVGKIDATAFLGGISLSLGSNFVQGKSKWVVIEADEFDRSFLHLSPAMAIITAVDPDHLDIYGDEKSFREAFGVFQWRIKRKGVCFTKMGAKVLRPRALWMNDETAKQFNMGQFEETSYGVGQGKYKAVKVRVEDGFFVFDYKSPMGDILNIKTTLPGEHNVENAVAAIAVAQHIGVSPEAVREALATFKGIRRRFEFIYRNDSQQVTFIDDYAHHPTELAAAIRAARTLYPTRRLIGIFQPHLFTRTRDFQDGFAAALDTLDETVLMSIYPARELPIEGVTSDMLLNKMLNPHKRLATKENVLDILRGVLENENLENTTILTLGAGDIDTFVKPIGHLVKEILDKQAA